MDSAQASTSEIVNVANPTALLAAGAHRCRPATGPLPPDASVYTKAAALAAPPATGVHPRGLRERLLVGLSRNKGEPQSLAEF